MSNKDKIIRTKKLPQIGFYPKVEMNDLADVNIEEFIKSICKSKN